MQCIISLFQSHLNPDVQKIGQEIQFCSRFMLTIILNIVQNECTKRLKKNIFIKMHLSLSHCGRYYLRILQKRED